ncbi:hypothetical protein [Nocardia australiensis]|uniref:hypothetical protein n=1 Tax=Nocardia australiensis TaxID=2887191 RepID=UPI001D145AFA|nr:hypothetical protein [Nocardia australiensis]
MAAYFADDAWRAAEHAARRTAEAADRFARARADWVSATDLTLRRLTDLQLARSIPYYM